MARVRYWAIVGNKKKEQEAQRKVEGKEASLMAAEDAASMAFEVGAPASNLASKRASKRFVLNFHGQGLSGCVDSILFIGLLH